MTRPAPTRVRAYGPGAVLVDVPTAEHASALAARVRDEPGVADLVPAARTLLVRCEPGAVGDLVDRLAALPLPDPAPAGEARTVTIDVVYDGPDLEEVARATGLTPGEVVRRHTAATYRAAHVGFAPGFCYLHGLDPALVTARRAQPRTRVPAGAVAVAADLTAVYPRSSPGGWNLLGRTDAVMFDLAREQPSLVVPGDLVRFREAR